jgi:hypothetical protein
MYRERRYPSLSFARAALATTLLGLTIVHIAGAQATGSTNKTATPATDTKRVVAQTSKMPSPFVGTWTEYTKGAAGDTVIIRSDGTLLWNRTDEYNKGQTTFNPSQYTFAKDGKEIHLVAKNSYQFGQGFTATSDMQVVLSREANNLILESTKTQSSPIGPLHAGSNAGVIGSRTDRQEFRPVPSK